MFNKKAINKVLIIDDDITSVFLIQDIIEGMNITEQVLTASNGQEGLDTVERYCLNEQAAPLDCPDLILLDLNMPIMNGFEFIEHLKQIGQSNLIEAKVIVLSTSANKQDIEKSQSLGVKHYLVKPLTADKLLPLLA